jgi:hypothetical protein
MLIRYASRGDALSFILQPRSGDDVKINAWNWVPTLMILDRNRVLLAEQLQRMRYNGAGGSAGADDARRISTFLDTFLLKLQPGQRVLWDGSLTSEPDTFEVHRDDPTKNYSATYDWLVRFRDFCRLSEGFDVL